jgi:hypothetical protein
MRLFAAVILAAVLIGFAIGGRLSRLEAIHPRWWGLAILGLGLQFVPLPEGAAGTDLVVRTSVLVVSYAMLIGFAILNLRLAGMWLVLIGILCNFAVITVNGGMPVGEQALIDSGQADVLETLRTERTDKHHLQDEDDMLVFLADVIAIPPPIGQAVSVGDVFMYVGLIWVIAAAMRRPAPSRTPESTGRYRGKHRRAGPQARAPRSTPDRLPAATRSGT